ncbi:hypothetical protein EVAR_61067_1 [Eumeta japonica]|uniref:Uncharacterized protein n=1 Tax=Eumeta variegata TaxID=151549 RepID=A0A4C1Z961_EUMVA|nr:hypothetical protein EVAR_61067_1 [Eumeta japonica]
MRAVSVDRCSFSGPSGFSIVEFLRSGRSGDPPLHQHSQIRPRRSRKITVNTLTPLLGFRLNRENYMNWTPERGPSPLDRRGRSPDEKTPEHEATNKSSVPHLQPERKDRGRPTNERTGRVNSIGLNSTGLIGHSLKEESGNCRK